jgi:hypothetical protein
MRRALFLICVLGLPCASWAQNDQASWTSLSALQPGQKIQIVDMKSIKHSGSFVNFSETAISYQDSAGGQTIQKPDVRSVKLMENKHRLRNMAIGAALGVGVAVGITAAAYHPCSGPNCINVIGKGAVIGIVALPGLAVGAVVGVLWPDHKTIYKANAH